MKSFMETLLNGLFAPSRTRPGISRCSAAALILVCVFSITACREQNTMTGAAATVDGQTITFRDLEARRSVLFSGRSPRSVSFDDTELRRQYRYILGQMIEELLICQYMENNGLTLEEGQLAAEEKRIRNDYPPGAFEAMLLELAVDEDRWREGIYRRLMVEQFIAHVLRPEISISAEEVQAYYREHSAEFVIPEQWHFLQLAGNDKSEVEKAAKRLVAGKNAALVQKEFLVTIHDIKMGADMLPQDLLDDLSPLQPWQSSPVRSVDDGFRVFVFVEKTPSAMLDAAEMSKRVEQALAEEKARSVYEKWIQKHLRKADIRLAPPLADASSTREVLGAVRDRTASSANGTANEAAPY